MMNGQLQQQIVEHLQYLNMFQLAEIFDFVRFLEHKPREMVPAPDVIDTLCGKYAHRLSSSEEFARRKQEEIRLEEAK
ncbi:hypothetical protein U27_04277 [Candidatus Vecturithrix granuli]|uniref:DUF2281 domain-containing protein n=1 Tax=Vecturithrix granuli TaxID=1499967 RepID=A0A081BYA7_VECG1|nr:hypothetical protein U27_04277 [Candidatus Vecturithrix granuli]